MADPQATKARATGVRGVAVSLPPSCPITGPHLVSRSAEVCQLGL